MYSNASGLLSIPLNFSVEYSIGFKLPSIYPIIFSKDSSHVLLASGLKESIAGLITGRNLSSIRRPLCSVIDRSLVKNCKASDPTNMIQSYESKSISISTSRFSTFFLNSEQR